MMCPCCNRGGSDPKMGVVVGTRRCPCLDREWCLNTRKCSLHCPCGDHILVARSALSAPPPPPDAPRPDIPLLLAQYDVSSERTQEEIDVLALIAYALRLERQAAATRPVLEAARAWAKWGEMAKLEEREALLAAVDAWEADHAAD